MKIEMGDAARAIRKRLGLGQAAFWSRVGVTQSAGSRYESGRSIPRPVVILMKLAYGTDAEARAMLQKLRSTKPEK